MVPAAGTLGASTSRPGATGRAAAMGVAPRTAGFTAVADVAGDGAGMGNERGGSPSTGMARQPRVPTCRRSRLVSVAGRSDSVDDRRDTGSAAIGTGGGTDRSSMVGWRQRAGSGAGSGGASRALGGSVAASAGVPAPGGSGQTGMARAVAEEPPRAAIGSATPDPATISSHRR